MLALTTTGGIIATATIGPKNTSGTIDDAEGTKKKQRAVRQTRRGRASKKTFLLLERKRGKRKSS